MRSGLKPIGLILITALLSLSSYASAQDITYWILALAWNPDGTILAAGGKSSDGASIWFYDVDEQLVDQIDVFSDVLSVSWSPDGSKIAARVGSNPETFSIWDTATRELLVTFEHPGATLDYFAYWNPAGDKLATAVGSNVLIHDTSNGTKIAVLPSPGTNLDFVFSVAWNADGSKLFAASADDVVRVWDIATESIINTFNFAEFITTMALSPDKRKLAVGLSNRTVQILDSAKGTLLTSFSGSDTSMPGGSVAFLKWHPDGNQIASASFDNIKIWDIENSTTVITFTQIDQSYPEAMDYSIDGKFAYIGSDGNITILDPSQVSN